MADEIYNDIDSECEDDVDVDVEEYNIVEEFLPRDALCA